MSRLYAVMASAADVAAQFTAAMPTPLGVPLETMEGHPGLVVLASNGRRLLKAMTWGVPCLTR